MIEKNNYFILRKKNLLVAMQMALLVFSADAVAQKKTKKLHDNGLSQSSSALSNNYPTNPLAQSTPSILMGGDSSFAASESSLTWHGDGLLFQSQPLSELPEDDNADLSVSQTFPLLSAQQQQQRQQRLQPLRALEQSQPASGALHQSFSREMVSCDGVTAENLVDKVKDSVSAVEEIEPVNFLQAIGNHRLAVEGTSADGSSGVFSGFSSVHVPAVQQKPIAKDAKNSDDEVNKKTGSRGTPAGRPNVTVLNQPTSFFLQNKNTQHSEETQSTFLQLTSLSVASLMIA